MSIETPMRPANRSYLEADVVVIGAGSSGLMAATAAARNGADVLLVDRYGFIGGTATIIHSFLSFRDEQGEAVIGGLPEEFMNKVQTLGGSIGHQRDPILTSATPTDVEIFKYAAMEMALGSGVRLLLHSWFESAQTVDGVIESITVFNKSGHQTLRAKCFIDCSGDGDVAAAAGAPVESGDSDGTSQPMTMTFRMAGFDHTRFVSYLAEHPDELNIGDEWPAQLTLDYLKNEKRFTFFAGFEKLIKRVYEETGYKLPRNRLHFYCLPRDGYVQINTSRVLGKDATDAIQLTEAEIEGRRQVWEISQFVRKYVAGFEDAYVIDTPMQIGIRESRRIMGEYVLTRKDVLESTNFPDAVGQGIYPLDIHHPQGLGSTIIKPNVPYKLPYRILTPRNLENCLVAGRCVSATHEALGAIRVIANCMMMGQAAGTAAAIAARSNRPGRVKEIRIEELQSKLVEAGAIL
jgi:hypothetical protein